LEFQREKSCANLAPFRQKSAKNDNKLQPVRILEIVKKPHKSNIFRFCSGAFKAKIRVRFSLAVPKYFQSGSRFARKDYEWAFGLRQILDSGFLRTGLYEIHSAASAKAERPVHLWAHLFRARAGRRVARLSARFHSALHRRMFLQELQAEEGEVSAALEFWRRDLTML
jgi:hypothetical protein